MADPHEVRREPMTSPLSPEYWRWIEGFIDAGGDFVANEAPDPEVPFRMPLAVFQHDAASPAEQEMRDTLLYGIELRLGVNVREQLAASEQRRAEQGLGKVTLYTWMKRWLQITSNPDEITLHDGVERYALLRETATHTYWLQELEIPVNVPDEAGNTIATHLKRVLWYTRLTKERTE